MKIQKLCAKCHRVLTTKTYCKDCAKLKEKLEYRARNKEWQYLYDGRWRRIRIEYLKINPLCHVCMAKDRTTVATEVHHIVAHRGSKKLFYNPHNLMGLCKSCHSQITAIEKFKQRVSST